MIDYKFTEKEKKTISEARRIVGAIYDKTPANSFEEGFFETLSYQLDYLDFNIIANDKM